MSKRFMANLHCGHDLRKGLMCQVHNKKCKSCDEQPLPRIQKVQTGNMYHRSTRIDASTSAAPTLATLVAIPLFRNILRTSPCDSRFCPDRPLSKARNPMKRRILGVSAEKNYGYTGRRGSQAKGRRHKGSALDEN